MIELLAADWPAPPWVRAGTTTRAGGVSAAPFDRLNLGAHVGDDPDAVRRNRERLVQALGLPAMPDWPEQVHGNRVLDAGRAGGHRGDALYTDRPGVVCAVLTADCLPLLLCDRRGERVCAAHAGWRGLFGGIVEAAVERFDRLPGELLAWLGPAIGPACFEVGDEVREVARRRNPELVQAFRPVNAKQGHWWLDIYRAARILLASLGVRFVAGGGYCTVSSAERFYSYRRDGRTGRMASLIWIDERRKQ